MLYNNTIMVLAGLTGNFGMGKSSVLRFFEGLGAVTISCDAIVGELLEKREIIESLRGLLGEGVTGPGDGLDKKGMARKIFRDAVSKKKVEDLLHPLVFAEIDKTIRRPEYAGSIIVVEVPLLFESGSEGRFDRTITVHTSEEEALHRLEQKGICREEGLARLHSQLPIGEKVRRSDFVIDNGGSPEETKRQVEEIYEKLVSLSRTS